MRISSWAAMTKRHRGRQWHCRPGRTFRLDYASPPQAMQWPDVGSKHIGQWLGCGNSIPRYVFPLLKTCCLIGVLKISRDTKKDCGEPGCPNDHRRQVLARGRGDRMSADFRCCEGFRTWRDVLLSPLLGGIAEVGLRGRQGSF